MESQGNFSGVRRPEDFSRTLEERGETSRTHKHTLVCQRLAPAVRFPDLFTSYLRGFDSSALNDLRLAVRRWRAQFLLAGGAGSLPRPDCRVVVAASRRPTSKSTPPLFLIVFVRAVRNPVPVCLDDRCRFPDFSVWCWLSPFDRKVLFLPYIFLHFFDLQHFCQNGKQAWKICLFHLMSLRYLFRRWICLFLPWSCMKVFHLHVQRSKLPPSNKT